MKTAHFISTLLVVFICFTSTSIAQEINYKKVATIAFDSQSKTIIETLKRVATNNTNKSKMIDLLEYDAYIEELTQQREDYVFSMKKKIKENEDKAKEIQEKIEDLTRKAKDLKKSRDHYEAQADMHYRNHKIATTMNNTSAAKNNYNSYKQSHAKYERYFKEYKAFLNNSENRNRELVNTYNKIANDHRNLIDSTNKQANEYQNQIDDYKSKRANLSNEIYKICMASNYQSYNDSEEEVEVEEFEEIEETVIESTETEYTDIVDSNKTSIKKESNKELNSNFIHKNKLANWVEKGNNLQTLKNAADSEKAFAQRRLARIYQYVYKDDIKALYWRKKAAQNGDAIAQSNLGADYERGQKGLEINQNEAVKWYRKSALQGHKFGQYNLASSYEYGIGVTKNLKEAFNWYLKSAEQGYTIAESKVGDFYYDGKGVTENKNNAFYWYMKVAQKDDPYHCYLIGKMYYEGIGHLQHFREGKHWLKKSANLGEKLAKEYLNKIEKPKNEKWTNKMTIREIEIKDNRTRKTLKTIEVKGEINIDLDNELIKIFQILEGKEETLILNFKSSDVKEEGQDYNLANEYVKGFKVRSNGSEVPVKIMRSKGKANGLFLLFDKKITMIYHFDQK